jgi:hypothetical protein
MQQQVTCEEIVTEEDLFEIRGIHWQEQDGLHTLCDDSEIILEEIELEGLYSMDDKTDAGLEVGDADEKTEYCGVGSSWESRQPPSIEEAHQALLDLQVFLRPRCRDRADLRALGSPATITPLVKRRLEFLERFLECYVAVDETGRTRSYGGGKWTQASEDAALFTMKGPWQARNLRSWGKAYINDRTDLPTHRYGQSNISRIRDETLAADIKAHLQSIGKFVSAQDIVDYLKDPDIQMYHGFRKSISLATAQWWMKELGYHWKKEPKGQYLDGHEREDVVRYHQDVFLPLWQKYQSQMRSWEKEEVPSIEDGMEAPSCRPVVVWFHDESTFYANDRRKLRWVHKSEGAVPQPKGEGASLMVADFVSADYGWLRSPDGKSSARVLFKAGKQRDGYYTNDDIIEHASKAMDILHAHFPHEDHVLVFDNASIHLKRAENSLSARNLPKNPSSTWGISVTAKDEHGNMIYSANGKPSKVKIHMAPGQFANGLPQSLYFPEGHEKAGWFKGMAEILRERGYTEEAKLKYECGGFKCPPEKEGKCCCRRVLYNQADFANIESRLETICRERGFPVLFLPKFH